MRLILLPALIATLLLGPIGCSYDSNDKPLRWYPDRHAGTAVVCITTTPSIADGIAAMQT